MHTATAIKLLSELYQRHCPDNRRIISPWKTTFVHWHFIL